MSFDLRNVDMVGPDKTNRSCYSEVQSGISFNVSSWARFGKKISFHCHMPISRPFIQPFFTYSINIIGWVVTRVTKLTGFLSFKEI